MSTQERALVIGSSGQIGVELMLALGERLGTENVIGADIRPSEQEELKPYTLEMLNVLHMEQLETIVDRHGITTVYNLAAMLSATAEKYPEKAWDLNMVGLFNVLDLAKAGKIKKVFWPSSIAVFGLTTPKTNTPQTTVCEPNTVYGISKLAGERWCAYYYENYGVDVRSIRYPGLIGYRSAPGGGTTDYAVEIFHEALEHGRYTSFLGEETRLPMMYIEEAIRATIQLMEAPPAAITVRSSYNVSGVDFTPVELADGIRRFLGEFELECTPDFRQKIADTWPDSIDDTVARHDWGWQSRVNLDSLVETMIEGVRKKKVSSETL